VRGEIMGSRKHGNVVGESQSVIIMKYSWFEIEISISRTRRLYTRLGTGTATADPSTLLGTRCHQPCRCRIAWSVGSPVQRPYQPVTHEYSCVTGCAKRQPAARRRTEAAGMQAGKSHHPVHARRAARPATSVELDPAAGCCFAVWLSGWLEPPNLPASVRVAWDMASPYYFGKE
jgi:hypothetical protein